MAQKNNGERLKNWEEFSYFYTKEKVFDLSR